MPSHRRVLFFVVRGVAIFTVAAWPEFAVAQPSQSSSIPRAQPSSTSPRPQPIAAAPREFPASGITLEAAVDLTLELNPDIALARAELNRAQGQALEQQGQFDAKLWGRLFYEHRQQELTRTIKDFEQKRRTDMSDALGAARRDFDRLRELSRLLGIVRGAAPGSAQVNAIAAISPDVASQIKALDVLIAGQTNAAVRAQLNSIRNEFIDRTIADASDGAANAIDGFQEGEDRLRRLGATPTDEVLSDAGFELNLSRRLRNGVNVTPFFNSRFESDNYKGKPHGEDDGGKGLEDLYTFRAGVATEVPLGRGRGESATAAFERAAARESEAARFDLQFRLSAVVNDTIVRYWELRAAMGSRDAIAAQLERQTRLVELTRAAIDAGEQPQVELSRVQASEARARGRLRDAERALVDARVSLATVLGVAADERDATLPLAADAFPAVTADALESATTLGAAAAAARADQQAAEQRQLAGQALETGARADLRPKLDLRPSLWFTALAEGSAGDALDGWVGPSADIQLEYERPFGNNEARGRFAQRQAEARQQQIDAGRSAREISLNVLGVAESVALARARVGHAQSAVAAYEQTGTAEVERFRAGESTLIDVLVTEAQQTDARLALVAAEQELSTLIARLRFESGTLIRVDRQLVPHFLRDDLVSIPREVPRR